MGSIQKFSHDGFSYEQTHVVPAGGVWERWNDAGDTVEFAGRAALSHKADEKQVIAKFQAVDKRLGRSSFAVR